MLVAYRLAGLSALGAHYAGVKSRAMRANATLLRGPAAAALALAVVLLMGSIAPPT